jgi:hypothetical protein
MRFHLKILIKGVVKVAKQPLKSIDFSRFFAAAANRRGETLD